MKISLVGMTMVGKTTLAQKIAHYFGFTHIDTDNYIENIYKTSIPNLFSSQGELGFRRMEREILKQILLQYANKDFILSCGGGLPCFYDNMQTLLKHTYCIYLEAPLSFFEYQIQNSSAWKNRPLLNTQEPLQTIKKLLSQRVKYYAQAHYKQPVYLNLEQTYQELIQHLKEK
ncbi:MAG: shikimate kinase [Bacteroidia bacterium]|nr:shikimate kinase [Bacteroidia bacterium]MDW8300989.1 shikimate kinase [Bacteroidia bacterium]